MRLGFLGSPSFAVHVLDELVDHGHDVALVVTRADKRRGRGSASSPTPVKAEAVRLGIEVTEKVGDLAGAGVELGIVVAYGAIVPAAVLEVVPMLNLHFSLLPRWRGAAPIERAILAGDVWTGVSVMGLEPTLDTGPVYARAEVPVEDKDLETLRKELVVLGAALLVHELEGGRSGLSVPEPQHGEPTYAAKVTDDELELDFTRPAVEVARVVRLGRARTVAAGRRLAVRRAEVLDAADGRPGELHGDVVTCGRGGLRLVSIVPEGRREMDAWSWRRGLRDGAPTHLGRQRDL
ncbi:MAG TPA: methionyl-tRNA formyltransferase [Acidimicrobiales bacterium]|jgi:methionyl-tRNA formyltransferase|nr:methionyl-tRNA formyltransferase [Acidimicrobiales bacterium]